MIFFVSFLAGFIIGWRKAKRMHGSTLDRLQYGAAFGIALTLLCLFIEITILRLGV